MRGGWGGHLAQVELGVELPHAKGAAAEQHSGPCQGRPPRHWIEGNALRHRGAAHWWGDMAPTSCGCSDGLALQQAQQQGTTACGGSPV